MFRIGVGSDLGSWGGNRPFLLRERKMFKVGGKGRTEGGLPALRLQSHKKKKICAVPLVSRKSNRRKYHQAPNMARGEAKV